MDKPKRPSDRSLAAVVELAEAYMHHKSLISDGADDDYDASVKRLRKAENRVSTNHIAECRRWIERNVD